MQQPEHLLGFACPLQAKQNCLPFTFSSIKSITSKLPPHLARVTIFSRANAEVMQFLKYPLNTQCMVLPQGFLSVVFVIFVDLVDMYFLHIVGQFPGFLSHTTFRICPGRGPEKLLTPPPRCNLTSLGLHMQALHLAYHKCTRTVSQGSHDTQEGLLLKSIFCSLRDPSSIFTTHFRQFTTTYNSNFRGSNTFLLACGIPKCLVPTCTHACACAKT